MKNNNSLPLGILVGAVFPFIAYLLTKYSNLQATFLPGKPLAVYVIAAVLNLIIFRFAYRSGKDIFAKGVLLTTFLAMVILIYVVKLKV